MASQVERKGEKASQVQQAWRTRKDLQEVLVLNVAATKSIVRIMVEKTRKSEKAHTTGVHSKKCGSKDFIKKINSVKSQ